VAEPTDAVVRVVLACVCGSDLWYYRGESPFEPGPIGHEFVGVVEDVGADVRALSAGDLVIAPFAYSTLVRVPGSSHSDETMRSLLTLSDVMCTGHHAAVSAGVTEGSVVAVVGDGAVGLSAVLAAARLGASRIIAPSRNPARQELARSFGARYPEHLEQLTGR
jgi:threonine dehydrogenase-like Zn-dependent dehydrogenase